MSKRYDKLTLERLASDLFRHLENPSRLRANPLVSEYFALTDASSHKQILREIRAALVSAARRAYSEDISRDLGRRAERTLAIVVAMCEGSSAKQIASHLQLSLAQFYRERRSAILRTVDIFLERRERFVVVDVEKDVYKLRLARIETLIDQGFTQRAVAEAQVMLQEIATPPEVVPVLCELSRAVYEFGDLARAKRYCDEAREQVGRAVPERDLLDGPRARIRLVEYYVSCMEDGPTVSYQRIDELARDVRLDYRILNDGDLAVQILLNASRSAVLVGGLAYATELLDVASAIASEKRSRASLQSKIEFMRAYAAGAGATLEPLESLTAALQSAQRAGSTQGVIFAALGLADFFSSQGRYELAKQQSEMAYQVARATEGHYFLTCVVDAVAAILLRTSRWRYAAKLLEDHPLPAGPYYAMRNASFQAQLLLRQKKYFTAATLLTEAAREAERLTQFRSLAMILPDLAWSEMKCGYCVRAVARTREAQEMVQRFGSASTRRAATKQIKILLAAE